MPSSLKSPEERLEERSEPGAAKHHGFRGTDTEDPYLLNDHERINTRNTDVGERWCRGTRGSVRRCGFVPARHHQDALAVAARIEGRWVRGV